MCRSSVLKISSFTLDDYENAIRHNIPELPCNLLAEVHACLLAVARERAGIKYMAMDSLEAQESVETDADLRKRVHSGISLADIAHEAKGLGYKAHMSGASPSRDLPRTGWEDALAIYIRDVWLIYFIRVVTYFSSCLPACHCAITSFSPTHHAGSHV